MKKIMIMLVAAIVVLCCGAEIVRGEESGSQKNVSGFLTLKNNWVNPQKGEDVFFQTACVFVQTTSPLGIGGDFTYQPDGDYVEYAPYLTLNSGPHYAIVGLSANSLGGDYVQAGYWHINKYGKVKVVADLRAYLETNSKSKTFLDNYLEVGYPMGASISASLAMEDIYKFDGAANTFQAGPIIYYKVSKSVVVFGRYLHAWSKSDAGKSQAEKFRLGIQYPF